MRFQVEASDGQSVVLETSDWMMALVRGVDRLGQRVRGFNCTALPGGVVRVVDEVSGLEWTVRPVMELSSTKTVLTPVAPPRRDRAPNRLAPSHTRRWRSPAPRPLWSPESGIDSQHAPADQQSNRPTDLPDLLFDNAAKVRARDSAQAAYDVTLSEILGLVSAEGGSVLRGADDQALVFVSVQGGAGDSLLGTTVPWGMGIAGAARVGGVSLVVQDVADDERHYAEVDRLTGFRTRALLAVPIRTDDEFFGVIELVNPTAGRFERWQVQVVESLAGALAERLAGLT